MVQGADELPLVSAGRPCDARRLRHDPDLCRAYGAGPKVGLEWRLPMSPTAAHGWHVGADAGVLYGDWSPIFAESCLR